MVCNHQQSQDKSARPDVPNRNKYLHDCPAFNYAYGQEPWEYPVDDFKFVGNGYYC